MLGSFKPSKLFPLMQARESISPPRRPSILECWIHHVERHLSTFDPWSFGVAHRTRSMDHQHLAMVYVSLPSGCYDVKLDQVFPRAQGEGSNGHGAVGGFETFCGVLCYDHCWYQCAL